ncbi:hypothetical protein [Kribbella pratensis]|uniref:hypothetical protein n=1 Tax=Kribbella pratensis TaxID=2512112 RepID=UPI0010649E9D|nr:hypothetical protein [Kribbella pratensis]
MIVLVLLGLTFCVIPVVAHRFGEAAERAAETEAIAQGARGGVLAEHRVRFKESAAEMAIPFGIAAVLFALAACDAAGVGAARVLTWIVAAVLLVIGGFVTSGQLRAAQWTAAAFRRSSDPVVRGLDTEAIVSAAAREFPAWLRPLQVVRFLLTTVGLLVVIVALITPSAAAHFR